MEVRNRRARFDYDILTTYEAGIVLTGTEIKSIRAGKVSINDAYVIVRDGEVFLVNMHIARYDEGNIFNHEETRTRKLLLHKKEIIKIQQEIEADGMSVVPLKLYIKKNLCKVLIGVGKGKKNYDKRESIKKKDIDRQARRDFKEGNL